MANYACAKTVPDSTKLCLIKGHKTNFTRKCMPPIPQVCPMLCTRIHTCLPNNPYNLILPPPWAKG